MRQHILRYTAGNILTSLITSYFVWWRAACNIKFKRKLQKCIRIWFTIFNFSFGEVYIVGYTFRNRVKLDFRPYIRQYTSPNENFDYGYSLLIEPTCKIPWFQDKYMYVLSSVIILFLISTFCQSFSLTLASDLFLNTCIKPRYFSK